MTFGVRGHQPHTPLYLQGPHWCQLVSGPDTGPDIGLDTGPDIGLDTGPDIDPDTDPDTGPDIGPDTGP